VELLRGVFTLEKVAMADLPADYRTPDILVLKGKLRAAQQSTVHQQQQPTVRQQQQTPDTAETPQ